ncbi:hypothetical protein [Pseudomonas oryziphila]|uniref:hypothetical protein n=1 Tax=Pseudomonas oryziphila TaxID=2894079 RepID=UPI001CB9B311|nr:hypothetical protein [Pseudomonas oryziphila]
MTSKMTTHKFCHADELLSAAGRLGVKAHLVDELIAEKYISFVLEKYKPWKKSGHLSIGDGTTKLPTDENEFVFFSSVKPGAGWIFFEQNVSNKNVVVVVDDVREISRLMEGSYGMEYFVSNECGDFLIAVNWYVIEYTDGAIAAD